MHNNSSTDQLEAAITMVERYKGKKMSIVLPQEVFEIIERIATDQDRSNSYIVVALVKDALKAQGHQLWAYIAAFFSYRSHDHQNQPVMNVKISLPAVVTRKPNVYEV